MTAIQIGEALGLDCMPIRQALGRLRERGLVRVAGYARDVRARGVSGAPGIWEAVPAA